MTHKYISKEQYIRDWGEEAYQEFLSKSYAYYTANKEKIDGRKRELKQQRNREKYKPIISYDDEVWKVIPNTDGKYLISNYGRCKSLNYNHTGCEKLLTPSPITGGYFRYAITVNGKHMSKKIHRLVAEAFIPNPLNLPQVNHKDEDKSNNTVWNLEWCDSNYNVNYGTGIERRAVAKKENKKGTPVLAFKDGVLYAEYTNVITAARELGINRDIIFHRINGKVKGDYKGFNFRRA